MKPPMLNPEPPVRPTGSGVRQSSGAFPWASHPTLLATDPKSKAPEDFAPYTHFQSQRDYLLRPRVARNELPWVGAREKSATPAGLRLGGIAKTGTTPLGLSTSARCFPRVARPSQPWALSRNPFGILSFLFPGLKMRLRCRGDRRTPKRWRAHVSAAASCRGIGL